MRKNEGEREEEKKRLKAPTKGVGRRRERTRPYEIDEKQGREKRWIRADAVKF